MKPRESKSTAWTAGWGRRWWLRVTWGRQQGGQGRTLWQRHTLSEISWLKPRRTWNGPTRSNSVPCTCAYIRVRFHSPRNAERRACLAVESSWIESNRAKPSLQRLRIFALFENKAFLPRCHKWIAFAQSRLWKPLTKRVCSSRFGRKRDRKPDFSESSKDFGRNRSTTSIVDRWRTLVTFFYLYPTVNCSIYESSIRHYDYDYDHNLRKFVPSVPRAEIKVDVRNREGTAGCLEYPI